MCNSPLHKLLTSLPKVEQHLHIEGTLEPELLFALAAKNGIDLPSPAEDPAYASPETLLKRYADWSCLDDFLAYYYRGMSVLITAADFEMLAWRYLVAADAQRVRHAEIFFDPQAHTARGVSYDTVVAGLDAAKRRAAQELPGMSVEFIVCILRHLPVPESHALVDTVLASGHLADGTLRGFGMVSSEKAFPPELFTDVYARVGAAMGTNAYLTAHAGEEAGPHYVTGALDALKVSRIDHGRAAGDSTEVMKRLAETQTLLTLCPWSNVALKNQDSMAASPVRKFLDAGVPFSLNSDDPAYFGMTIQEVYCAVQETFALSVDEWKRVCENGVKGSWCGEERKQAMLKEIGEVVASFA
ncbi:adenine deaminase [Lecanicillium sp. MT-2017a]|nr:adenine deaminase [Lecanicillium sp. MT-2017a]